MCLGLDLFCHAMCYCSPFVPFIAFSCVLAKWLRLDLDPMVLVIIHTPRPTSKGLDHSYLHVYACLLLCFTLTLASLILGFAMFGTFYGLDIVWLHPTPMRPCLDVTILEASPDARLLRVYPSLFCSARCYAYHACLCHPFTFYASLHACSHVHAWVLLASVLSMLQHNEVMDIWSKPTFVPCGHHLLLALCFLSYLFAFSLVCLISCFFACHVYHTYLLYASFVCSLHLFLPLLVCRFPAFAFACTHIVMRTSIDTLWDPTKILEYLPKKNKI